jgi:Short C-terminal domain
MPVVVDRPNVCRMDGPLTDRGRLHRKANEALDQNLTAGESVEVIITGPSNQAMIGTSRRVFVYKKGFMAGASFGSELTSWDYRHLVGVQLHTGMLSGAVVLQAPGQSGTATSTWKQGDADPYKAPNAIPIKRPWEPAADGVARLRQLIDEAHQPPSGVVSASPSSQAQAPDPIVQLKQLGELRDAGVLTDKEFEAKKAKILGRI